MVNAHDLLWGMTPAHLPSDAPGWALEAIGAGHPVVVRRAMAEPGRGSFDPHQQKVIYTNNINILGFVRTTYYLASS